MVSKTGGQCGDDLRSPQDGRGEGGSMGRGEGGMGENVEEGSTQQTLTRQDSSYNKQQGDTTTQQQHQLDSTLHQQQQHAIEQIDLQQPLQTFEQQLQLSDISQQQQQLLNDGQQQQSQTTQQQQQDVFKQQQQQQLNGKQQHLQQQPNQQQVETSAFNNQNFSNPHFINNNNNSYNSNSGHDNNYTNCKYSSERNLAFNPYSQVHQKNAKFDNNPFRKGINKYFKNPSPNFSFPSPTIYKIFATYGNLTYNNNNNNNPPPHSSFCITQIDYWCLYLVCLTRGSPS